MPLRVQKAASHFQKRMHASAFLNHWTSGTLSLQDGQLSEWIPIISSAVGVHMEMLDQTPLLPTFYQDSLGTLTRSCPPWLSPVLHTPVVPGSFARIVQVTSRLSTPRNTIHPRRLDGRKRPCVPYRGKLEPETTS